MMTTTQRLAFFLVLFLFVLAPLARAAENTSDPIRSREDAQKAYEHANALYGEQEFARALEEYQRIYRAGFGTREVLANAGNAAYHEGDVGRAVLAYHRALRVDPGYQQARENLERIQPATNTPEGQGVGTLAARWFRATPAWGWFLLAEALFVWCLAAGIIAVRSAPGTEKRSAWTSRTAAALILAVAGFGAVLLHDHLQHDEGDAVVVEDRAVTRLGPGEEFFEQLELPAGTVATIKGVPRNGWVQIVLRDGSSGYIQTTALERI
ncbi:MAG: hypothetical protein PWP23_1877 [Candidatus Sumerlaeota bacterium]|nr:hypothetical protein [Candidatus Sumerlaeota bacterium]